MENSLEITPQQAKAQLDAGAPVRLIDVREPAEYAIAHVEGSELIPMGSVPAQLSSLEAKADDAKLIVICHHGVRSLQVVAWLRRQGLENCVSMAGGIDLWSLDVDPGIPRY